MWNVWICVKGFAAGSDSFYFQRKASHFTMGNVWNFLLLLLAKRCQHNLQFSATSLYCPVLSSRGGTGFEACTAQFFVRWISTSQHTGLNSALRCLSAMNTYWLGLYCPAFVEQIVLSARVLVWTQYCPIFVGQIHLSAKGMGLNFVLPSFCCTAVQPSSV